MPTTVYYREIFPVQEPFDLGLDETGRPRVAFNIRAIKKPSSTFAEEIVSILVTAGVGVSGTNIFVSSKVSVPAGAGPYLSIIETGGTAPLRKHNSVNTPDFQRPSAQIVARASSYSSARSKAYAAYNALVGIRNTSVTF